MKYYEGHEHAYQKLEAAGHDCWDKTAFDAFYMRPFLEAALKRLGPPGASERSLEIGCGTGPITCLLAERGYDALGVDISATAVRMAAKNAAARKLKAEFKVQDVLKMEGEALFDLIVDGHCLHCIVFNEERASLYAALLRLLKPGGALVMETMARHPDVRFDKAFLLDEKGVLWLHFPKGNPEDLKRIGDNLYHPNRRILRDVELSAELRRAGFAIEFEHTEKQEKAEETWLYQAIARKT
ncbi:MAG: class I SAM-dependent methyltransferase [Planctomycetes bacterium]|nr:class I SAM-dependent methyltransferase [Planctomycetota bacterium]